MKIEKSKKEQELDSLIKKLKTIICDGENIISSIENICAGDVIAGQETQMKDYTIIKNILNKFDTKHVFDEFVARHNHFDVTINGSTVRIRTLKQFEALLTEILQMVVDNGRATGEPVEYNYMDLLVLFSPSYNGYKENLRLMYVPYSAEV